VTGPEVGHVKACGPPRDKRRGDGHDDRPARRTGAAGGWSGGTGELAGAVDHSAPAAFGVAGGVW